MKTVYLLIWQDYCGGLGIDVYATSELRKQAFEKLQYPNVYHMEDHEVKGSE